MKQKKAPIKYKKQRVILSDILPYEIPLTFSNRHFYNFLVSSNITLDEDRIKWTNINPIIGDIIKLLFSFKPASTEIRATIKLSETSEFETLLSKFNSEKLATTVNYPERIIQWSDKDNSIDDILKFLPRESFTRMESKVRFINEKDLYFVLEKIYIKKAPNNFRVSILENTFTCNKSDPSYTEIINCKVSSLEFYLGKSDMKTIPFGYKISHKENDFRALTVIHPLNQLGLVSFYDKYKELILYYCSLSPFSIRKPHKIAKFTYFKDKTHNKRLAHDGDHGAVEEDNKEYENLKTFFVYKKYSNIHKFYESYKYHRCEKKYDQLVKFDISKCFDSIYTHSIAWSLLNKKMVKDKLPESKETFGGIFDRLMQDLNYGETNGIVIGPEFSRIFAEIILQQVDKNIVQLLKMNGKYVFRDYEVYRYVDDFFIFFNDEEIKNEILALYKLQLNEYKLHFNDSKTKLFGKPIITEITIAKQKISDLLNNHFAFKINEKVVDVEEGENGEEVETVLERKYSIYVSSNKLITKFKTIVKETGVDYKDILNYTFSSIDRKVSKLLKDYIKIEDKDSIEKALIKAILEIFDFIFFLYSVSPRVNTTIKLCMILSRVIKFLKREDGINYDDKNLVFKKISDEIFLVLRKNKNEEPTPVETLYLLLALMELGREYRLEERTLCEYFKIDSSTYKVKTTLNYFSIIVLLFYIGDRVRYSGIKRSLQTHILSRFDEVGIETVGKTAEFTFLLFDLISCPYLKLDFKKEVLARCGITDSTICENIVSFKRYWFTKWSNFKFDKELNAKKSLEVY